MVKVEIKNEKNPHYPLDMMVEVDEEHVEELVEKSGFCHTKEYKKRKEEIVKSKNPDESWTEKQIKKWIEENNVDIKYNINTDSKKEILQKLREKGVL